MEPLEVEFSGHSKVLKPETFFSSNACAGLLFFHIPGGIQYGNYNLNVHFAKSIVKVPMKIMTKDEAKAFEKQWKQALKEAKHKGHEH